ncbi:MAG: xylulokinase [Vallitaleaceae bacterium]|jgi:xylulokinase|nr:xylulokinase [Vallitaleaceae bacterium]
MIFLGIDLGTSSVKILATNEKHEIVGDVTKEYPVSFPQDKWAEQDPHDWWTQTKAAIIELVEKYDLPKDSIRSIGFSGQMHGLVALDVNDDVLLPAILWCDNRTEAECDDITNHFGKDKLRDLVGNKALTGFTAPKVLWVKKNRPDLFAKIEHIMLPKDYVRLCLTGDYAIDQSDAAGTIMLDVANRTWSKEMCKFLGVKDSWLPKLYESYEVTGTVTEAVKAELGLEGEILVVGGAGDQAAGAVGTGTVREGIVSVTLGTSGVVFAAHETYAVDEDCRLHAFCHANGKYHSMGVMLSAANCLNWWVENINKGVGFETLLAEAELVEAGSNKLIFLPYLMGERTPYADADAKGCFIGLDMNTSRGHMTRAVLEGVSFGLNDSLEILRDLKVPINEVRVIGGGAKSPLWKQILADVFNVEIQEINTNQGGGLGAAILAAVGAGVYKTVEEGCDQLIRVTNTVKPIPANVAMYQKTYPLYNKLYGDLASWFKVASN